MTHTLLTTDKYVVIHATGFATGLRVTGVDMIQNLDDTVVDADDNGLDDGDHLGGGYRITRWMVEIGGKNWAIFASSFLSPSGGFEHYIPFKSTTDSFTQAEYDAAIQVGTLIDTPIDYAAVANCFATGTLIETDQGEVPVEDLEIGDRVRALNGLLVPVKWIGRQRVPGGTARLVARQPMVIEAGALGRNTPHTDLCVSEDHALLIPGGGQTPFSSRPAPLSATGV